jgi:hypothetical protein
MLAADKEVPIVYADTIETCVRNAGNRLVIIEAVADLLRRDQGYLEEQGARLAEALSDLAMEARILLARIDRLPGQIQNIRTEQPSAPAGVLEMSGDELKALVETRRQRRIRGKKRPAGNRRRRSLALTR